MEQMERRNLEENCSDRGSKFESEFITIAETLWSGLSLGSPDTIGMGVMEGGLFMLGSGGGTAVPFVSFDIIP